MNRLRRKIEMTQATNPPGSVMVNKRKTLPLVGLVITVPTGAALAPPSTKNHRSGGSSTALGASNNEASRRAFLATTSSAVVGTSFALPAKATRGPFNAPAHLGNVKRTGKWQGVGGNFGSDSSDSDSIGTSDSDSSVDSIDDEKEKAIEAMAMNIDVPTKLAYNGLASVD